jgi:peptide/nickel transport system substrate-binding protein
VRVHNGKALIAAVAALALGLTACSSSGGSKTNNGSSSNSSSTAATDPNAGKKGTGALTSCPTDPNGCNSGKTKPGGTIRYVLEKTIPGWNELLSTSNVFELAEVEDGILPSVYINGPDLKPFLNTDLMASVDSKTVGGKQVITYNIKPTAVWSDGSPINFDDFQYVDYTSDGTHCPKCGAASSAGYNAIASMKGSNNGRTVTVTMKTPFADWQSMFGPLLPAHIAKQHGDNNTAAGLNASFQWLDKNVPTYSGGPMQITNYQKDTSVTLKPNPKWYGATKSSLDSLIFRIITDQTQEPTALQGGEVDAAYPQPNSDLVQRIGQIPNLSTYLGKGLVWEHFDFNEKNKFLADKQLRLAIFTAINRQDIIARTIGQFVQGATPLGNHMYVPGQPGYQDNVTSTGQGSGDIGKAKQILQTAGYTGVGSTLKTKTGDAVTFRCTYSAGNTNRQTECETVQNTLQQLGIKITLKTTSDLSELGTGNFDMIVFAWQGAPFVVAGAQQIWELKGGADYGANNDPAMEKLINEAAASTDQAKVQSLMNQADKLLTADAYVLPLYQKPSFLVLKNTLVNMRGNDTSSGPPYNVQEWGLKAS